MNQRVENGIQSFFYQVRRIYIYRDLSLTISHINPVKCFVTCLSGVVSTGGENQVLFILSVDIFATDENQEA